MTAPGAPSAGPRPVASALRWAGLVTLLACTGVRLGCSSTPLPGWDLDPLELWLPSAGIGPAGSLMLDAMLMAGAALVLLATAMERRPGPGPAGILLAIGTAGAALHAWVLPTATLEQRTAGFSLASAFAAGTAAAVGGRDPRFRRLATAGLVGLALLLVLKGTVQVWIEHPALVRQFEQDRAAVLAANGWSPDHPSARAYERRLRQPEATGWTGLANVYASVMAAAAVTLGGLAALRFQARDRAVAIACGAGAAAAMFGLVLSGSKGGVGALLVGLASVAVLARLRTHAPAPAAGAAWALACIVGVLALLPVRGMVAEQLGERSLLFRWYYAIGASRIALEQPLVGVGPAGFQEAYLAAKPPLSPEEVTSPHSILLDLVAALGVFGLAWIALWVTWVLHAGRAGATMPRERAPPPTEPLRPDARVLGAAVAAATLASTWVDRAITTPEGAIVRLLGLAAWWGLGLAIIRAASRDDRWTLPLAAGALALAAHMQIEMTGTQPASSAWAAMLLGTAASARPVRNPGVQTGVRKWMPAAALLAMSGAIAAFAAAPAVRWERQLALAAESVRPVGQIRSELRAAPGDAAARHAAAELALRLGHPVADQPEAIGAALLELEWRSVPAAANHLEAALFLEPTAWQIGREIARLHLRMASHARATNRPDIMRQALDAALDVSRRGLAARTPPAVSGVVWLAKVHEARAAFLGDDNELAEARRVLELVSPRDPYNLQLARQVMRLAGALGDAPGRAQWARKVLELDALARLDQETRALSPAEREEVVKAAQPP